MRTVDALTPRQLEALTLLAQGLSYRQIAGRMDLATETVRNHLRACYAVLHVESGAGAVGVAYREHLILPEPPATQLDRIEAALKRIERALEIH